jgi:hypothetical protein
MEEVSCDWCITVSWSFLQLCSTCDCQLPQPRAISFTGSVPCGCDWCALAARRKGSVLPAAPDDLRRLGNLALPQRESDIGTMGTDYGSLALSPGSSLAQGLSQYANTAISPTSTRGFKRSVSSDDEGENGDGDTRPSSSRRNTSVKRACNECRQQKVSNALLLHFAIHGWTTRMQSKI